MSTSSSAAGDNNAQGENSQFYKQRGNHHRTYKNDLGTKQKYNNRNQQGSNKSGYGNSRNTKPDNRKAEQQNRGIARMYQPEANDEQPLPESSSEPMESSRTEPNQKTENQSTDTWEETPNLDLTPTPPSNTLSSKWETDPKNFKKPVQSNLSADAPEFPAPSVSLKKIAKQIDEMQEEHEKRDVSLTFRDYEKNYRYLESNDDAYKIVKEIEADLFAMPDDFALANCVAEDMNMGSGIAISFRQQFKGMSELLAQKEKQGGCAFLERDGRYIYYLVTKRESNKKPTLETMLRSTVRLAALMKEHGVTKLAIPRIGCGLDRLEWSDVKNMLEYVFRGTNVGITVCNFQKNYGQTKQKLKTTPDKPKDTAKSKQKNKKHKGKK